VAFSLNALSRSLGYARAGGRTLELVEASIHRLMSVTIRMQLRVGQSVGMAEWHLLDRVFKVSRGSRGMGGVRLSEDYATLVSGGNVTLLDMRRLMAIVNAPRVGDIAARLYLMFEAQQGPGLRDWNFPVFRADDAGGTPGAYSPLVEFLGLTDRKHYRIRAQIEASMRTIEAVDPRYVGRLQPARKDGQFNLVVRRTSTDSRGARPRTLRVHDTDSGGRRPDRIRPATSSSNIEDERLGGRGAEHVGVILATVLGAPADQNATASTVASATPLAERPGSETGREGEFRQRTREGLSLELRAEWGLLE
jgi:hypothetical protein